MYILCKLYIILDLVRTLRDKTVDDNLMYIPNIYKQNYTVNRSEN